MIYHAINNLKPVTRHTYASLDIVLFLVHRADGDSAVIANIVTTCSHAHLGETATEPYIVTVIVSELHGIARCDYKFELIVSTIFWQRR